MVFTVFGRREFFFCKSDFRFILSSLGAFPQYMICYEVLRNEPRKNWPIGNIRNDYFSHKLATKILFGNRTRYLFYPRSGLSPSI